MVADGGGRALGVARLAGAEDLPVLGVEPLGREVHLRVDVQVGAGRVAQRLDHVHEARATGELVQLRVEPQVELQVPLDAGPGRHLVEHGGKLLAARRVEPLGRALRGERLERRADLVVLAGPSTVGTNTTAPRWGCRRTRPSDCSAASASRTGVVLTPKRCASSTWRSRVPDS